ncbi:hypothetical protein QLX67_08280 [Balneolaceae bacterium ANBcel3]|nr:hypothetical protein [Balneolaceae bacterium ANBcel3]
MNIGSVQNPFTHEITQGHGLRKAAETEAMPQLTDDESQMIKKQFTSASSSMSFYKVNGEKMDQMLAGRGMYIDVTV